MSIRTWVRDNIYASGKRLIARWEVQNYLDTTADALINIGCGGNRVPGWLNGDRFPPPGAIFMDATKQLPFRDSSVAAILCEHMIEHIPKAAAVGLVAEMFRILRPGGIVRIVTPDLTWLSHRVLEPPPPDAADGSYLAFLEAWHSRLGLSWCDAINLCFYEHGHRYIWSKNELSLVLSAAGFSNITETRAGCPNTPLFKGVEGHDRIMGYLPNKLEAFGLEAYKAPST